MLIFFKMKQCCTNFILLLAYFSKKPVLYVRVASKELFVRALVHFSCSSVQPRSQGFCLSPGDEFVEGPTKK